VRPFRFWAAAASGLILAAGAAAAQQPAEPLPRGDVFPPLVADPKQPQFFAAYLFATAIGGSGQIGSVGLGENIGLVRGRGGRWQVSLATGVFSQFDMATVSMALINTDFLVGIPFTWRLGGWRARARLYHQSSHLGDEFIWRTNPERVNYSFDAIELLLSRDIGRWRVYGGGEYLARRDPADVRPGVAHAGLEYRHAAPLVRIGRLGAGRLLGALDTKSIEHRRWQIAWSVRAGLEFAPAAGARDDGRRWSVQLHAFDGPAPYGHFYEADVSAVGLGLHFSL
jgi:hypothetical protein